jgi:DNA-binding protein HU-beta
MNKHDLIEEVSKKLQCSKVFSGRCICAVLEGIRKGVKKDGGVHLLGFGSFQLKNRKERSGYNPQTGRRMTIKAAKTVSFRPGKDFKESL